MRIERTTVPGGVVTDDGGGGVHGVLHQILTRAGARFGVLTGDDGSRQLFVYEVGGADTDVPGHIIALDADEADRLADILHSRPLTDRLLSLERRVDELIGERGR
ncbi:MAG: hypothetical protein JST91_24200 [Actinobacteria bacterium]|nr:hypothetical protein [Actinomycetota bacterium]